MSIDSPSRSEASSSPSSSTIEFPATDAEFHQFENGLVLIVCEDHAAPVASVQAWMKTGSIHEGLHLGAGISHLLEHMVFKGTGKRSASDLARDVQEQGGYFNAYTSFDRTVYWVDTPSSGVSTALDVVTDLALNATLPLEEYEKERDVIRREIDMGKDDPGRAASKLLFDTSFLVHPCREPVIGHLELFNRLSREDTMAYYKSRYVPNNMFLVVAGDVSLDQVRSEVESIFQERERCFLPPVYVPDEPAQLGRREQHIEFETQLSRCSLAWHVPGLTHPDMPALEVLSTVLGSGRSSRLYREVREGKGLAHAVWSYSYTPAQTGVFVAGAALDPERREAGTAAVHDAIRRIQDDGVTAEEVAKACRCTLADQLSSLTTVSGKASDLASNWLAASNLNFTRDFVESIAEVTQDQVRDVARRYLIDRSLSVTSLNPKGTTRTKAVAARATVGEDIQKFSLSNGATLLVREDCRLPLVSVHSTSLGGLLAETATTSGITSLMSKCLLKGTASRDAAAIAEVIESAGGSIGAGAGNNTFSVSLGVLEPELPVALDVISDVLMHPAFPEAEVAREREVQIAGIKAQEDNLVNVAARKLRGELFPKDHPYSRTSIGTEESVASLDASALAECHRKYAVGENTVISVFGGVDASQVRDHLEESLASFSKGQRAFEGREAASLEAAVPADEVIHRDKHQAVLTVGFRGCSVFDEDRLALELIDEACSDMASRLFVRIREEKGLAYYVGASQFVGLESGMFMFYLGTEPARLEEAREELLDEIRLMASEGLDPLEFERAKKTFLGKHLIELQSNSALSRTASLDELFGLGHSHYKTLSERVNALSIGEVNAAAARRFQESGRVIASVVPE